MSSVLIPAPKMRDRAARLLGEERLAEKVAAATTAHRTNVFRWFKEGEWPPYAVRILELLEHTPRKYWPEGADN